MKKRAWQNWIQGTELYGQPLPGVPLVELAGDGRVLIENHRGVLEYGLEHIRVKVSFGSLVVSGQNLHLRHMTQSRLVICGKVQGISLEGRA